MVEVAGEIDYHRGLSLAERVDGLLAGQPSHVTLDLSGVGFCASGTVSALVAVHQAAVKTDTDLDLVNVPQNLRRLLEISGVLDLFRIQPSAAGG